MTYDCFAFFNELDLLEIRLNMLDAVVDRFVLVECRYTFSKKPKPLYFEENKERFKAFLPKIEHIVLERFPSFRWDKLRVPHAWDCDNYQKEQITKVLKRCKPDDTILISDVDEIPDPALVQALKGKLGTQVFGQYYCNYFLNMVSVDHDRKTPLWWHGSVMIQYKDFRSVKKTRVQRGMRKEGIHIHNLGGWHFSFLGDTQKIIHKLESFAHTEFDTEHFKNPEHVTKAIQEGKDLFDSGSIFVVFPDEEILPEYIKANRVKYAHLIR